MVSHHDRDACYCTDCWRSRLCTFRCLVGFLLYFCSSRLSECGAAVVFEHKTFDWNESMVIILQDHISLLTLWTCYCCLCNYLCVYLSVTLLVTTCFFFLFPEEEHVDTILKLLVIVLKEGNEGTESILTFSDTNRLLSSSNTTSYSFPAILFFAVL